jgi:hypothetical protein
LEVDVESEIVMPERISPEHELQVNNKAPFNSFYRFEGNYLRLIKE